MFHAPAYGSGPYMLRSVRLSVRLMSLTQNGALKGYGYDGRLIGDPVVEVNLTGQRGLTATGNGRNRSVR